LEFAAPEKDSLKITVTKMQDLKNYGSNRRAGQWKTK